MFGNYGTGPGAWLLMIGLWAMLIATVLWTATLLFPDDNQLGHAKHILDCQLAAGEIDPETYEQLRGHLAEPGGH